MQNFAKLCVRKLANLWILAKPYFWNLPKYMHLALAKSLFVKSCWMCIYWQIIASCPFHCPLALQQQRDIWIILHSSRHSSSHCSLQPPLQQPLPACKTQFSATAATQLVQMQRCASISPFLTYCHTVTVLFSLLSLFCSLSLPSLKSEETWLTTTWPFPRG